MHRNTRGFGAKEAMPSLKRCKFTLQAPKKKVAAAPAAVRKQAAPAKPTNPLYEKRPKTFGAPSFEFGELKVALAT